MSMARQPQQCFHLDATSTVCHPEEAERKPLVLAKEQHSYSGQFAWAKLWGCPPGN